MAETRTGLVGFIGLGIMGRPMALNLVRAGIPVIVWNRSERASSELADAGAVVATDIDEVFASAEVVFVMLVDENVTDVVLGRGTPVFARRMSGTVLVSCGSTSADYARTLAADVTAAGGRFVESPVSGSRGPAEAGTLLALVGGDPDDVDRILPLLAPMTREAIHCGGAGAGVTMKLVVNHYLTVIVPAIAETTHLAEGLGIARSLVQRAIQAGPMASEVSGIKLAQLSAHDFEPRAAVTDAFTSTRLIASAAESAGVATPMLAVASELFRETVDLGEGASDMVAVLKAIEARSRS